MLPVKEWPPVCFDVQALRRLTPLQQSSSLRDEFCRDTHNALTTLLSCSTASLPCGIKADCRHGLPRCIQGVCLARLWRLLLKMTSIALVAIGGDDVIACHHLARLCLVPTLMSRSRLDFYILITI